MSPHVVSLVCYNYDSEHKVIELCVWPAMNQGKEHLGKEKHLLPFTRIKNKSLNLILNQGPGEEKTATKAMNHRLADIPPSLSHRYINLFPELINVVSIALLVQSLTAH